MGYNSVLVILNDRLDEIERDPDFGKKVATAIRHFSHHHPERMPYVTGQTQVISVEHADVAQVIRVNANRGSVLGYGGGWRVSDDDVIAQLVKERRQKRAELKKAPDHA